MAANRLIFVFILLTSTISIGISAADNEKSQPTISSSQTIAANKTAVDNSTKQLIDSLGPSQDYPDYEIPKELAPDGVAVVEDYTPISPAGGKDNNSDPIAQPEADNGIKTSPSSSASRSSSIVLSVVGLVGGASLFFF